MECLGLSSGPTMVGATMKRRATMRARASKRVLSAIAVIVAMGACDLRFDSYYHVGREAVGFPEDDAGVAQVMPWGTYAATLPVPDCPPGAVLTVDTSAEEYEGGNTLSDRAHAGERLSFPEALWIAANRPGPDTILFDSDVFPVDAPATILIQGGRPLPQDISPVCIDGRNRGVLVRWSDSAHTGNSALDSTYIWKIGAGSLQVGLQLEAPPVALQIEHEGQVAGCHLYYELASRRANDLVSLVNGRLGPGNVLSSPGFCMRSSGGAVQDNYFGYNPLTGEDASCMQAMSVYGGSSIISIIEGNVISAINTAVYSVFGSMVFRGNWIGEWRVPSTRDLIRLKYPRVALSVGSDWATIGPDNVIRAYETGVVVSSLLATVTITRNSILAPQGIRYETAPPVEAPTITSADSSQVAGTCAVSGRIEVFSGEEGQAEKFLGAADCGASRTWTLAASAPSGKALTATLTDTAGRTSVFSSPFQVP